MKIYIAGPMRGYEQHNFPAFDAARDKLATLGHEVISPADLDRKHGHDGHGEPTREFLAEALIRDIQAIRTVEAIVLLPGFTCSSGTEWEMGYAKMIGVPCYVLRQFLDREQGEQ